MSVSNLFATLLAAIVVVILFFFALFMVSLAVYFVMYVSSPASVIAGVFAFLIGGVALWGLVSVLYDWYRVVYKEV